MPKTNFLTPQVPIERLHPSFKALMELPHYAPARTLLTRIWDDFVDKDGNFLEQFQTTGFDARTWELFLFALLWDLGVDFDWTHQSPDYLFDYKGVRVCMEAVTVHPTQGPDRTIDESAMDATDAASIEHEVQNKYPIRLGSALYSKLRKRYWELPQVKDRPLILAIEDFHASDSLYSCGMSLWQYLYGFRGDWHLDAAGTLHVLQVPITAHTHGAKSIPSGFFNLPDTEHISAVLFGNTGTLAKFNRLGYLLGYGHDERLTMMRFGFCYDHEPNKTNPKTFSYQVGSPSAPPEDWGQGMQLFHNPNALHPLPIGCLPLPYHFLDEGNVRTFFPEFHPYASRTMTLLEKDTLDAK